MPKGVAGIGWLVITSTEEKAQLGDRWTWKIRTNLMKVLFKAITPT